MPYCVSDPKRSFGFTVLVFIFVYSGIQVHLSTSDTSIINPGISSEDSSVIQSVIYKRLQRRSLNKDVSDTDIQPPATATATLGKPTRTSSIPPPTGTPHSLLTSLTNPVNLEESTKSSSKWDEMFRKNHPHITDWSEVPERLFLRNHYTGNFSFANPLRCQEGKRDLKLVILITSAIDHFEQRESIRLTWGHYGAREDVVFAFVIGDALLATYSESVQSQLQKEIGIYDDFIIADLEDTYRNLTLKTLHMFDWVSKYCDDAQYFLKTDDDVFLNIPEILSFIDKIKDEDKIQPKIYGHIFSGHFPKRDVRHRHHLTYDVYPYNISYPNFTSGPAYLMPTAIVKPLFTEALKLPFIRLEDVLMNGFAAMNLGIPRVDIAGFLNETKNPISLTACEIIEILAGMLDGSAVQMNYVWYNWLMGRSLCIWNRFSQQMRKK